MRIHQVHVSPVLPKPDVTMKQERFFPLHRFKNTSVTELKQQPSPLPVI